MAYTCVWDGCVRARTREPQQQKQAQNKAPLRQCEGSGTQAMTAALPARPTLLASLGSSSGPVWACGPAGCRRPRQRAAKLLQDAVWARHDWALATQSAAISRIPMAVAVRFTTCLLAVRNMTHLAHRCGYGWTALRLRYEREKGKSEHNQ